MRRFRIMGLALLALFALSALTAAVVSAEEGALGSTTFQTVAGVTTLETGAGITGKIECQKTTGNGIFLLGSDQHGTATLDFTGCKAPGLSAGASTLGDAKETILSKVLFLICLAAGIFALLIQPLATEHIEIPTLGQLVLVKGAVIAENLSGPKGDKGEGKVFKHELVGKEGKQTKLTECKLTIKEKAETFKHTFESAVDSEKADLKASENGKFEVIFPKATELMEK